MRIRITERQHKALLKEAYWETGEFKVPEEKKAHLLEWEGRDVVWYGDPKRMIVVHKDDVIGAAGNKSPPDYFQTISNEVEFGDNMVEFECPPAKGKVYKFLDILNQQMSVKDGTFNSYYNGWEKPLTTGTAI